MRIDTKRELLAYLADFIVRFQADRPTSNEADKHHAGGLEALVRLRAALQAEPVTQAEAVDHPAHYSGGQVECIDAMTSAFGPAKVADFCQINAFKYTWRAGAKGDRTEDLAKAAWYLNRAILLIGREDPRTRS